MKAITVAELGEKPHLYEEIGQTLRRGGIVAFPVGSTYRLAADLASPEAVLRLMQTKRRAGHHPALVFIPDPNMLGHVGVLSPLGHRLATRFWPGPLTLVLPLGADLPPKVVKTLTRATGRIGVRCPETPIASQIMREFGGPLLVSSANMEKKSGAESVAKVRRSFLQRIDLLIDAGDLAPGPPSTLVEVIGTDWKILREGALATSVIEAVLRS